MYKAGRATNFPVRPELAAELDALTIEEVHQQFRWENQFAHCTEHIAHLDADGTRAHACQTVLHLPRACRRQSRSTKQEKQTGAQGAQQAPTERWDVHVTLPDGQSLYIGTYSTEADARTAQDAADYLAHSG